MCAILESYGAISNDETSRRSDAAESCESHLHRYFLTLIPIPIGTSGVAFRIQTRILINATTSILPLSLRRIP